MLSPDKLTWKWFRSKDKSCEIKIPTNWTVEENFSDYRLFLRSGYTFEEDRFMENISVYIQESPSTEGATIDRLKNYMKQVQSELPKILGKINLSEPRYFTAKNQLFCEIKCNHDQGGFPLQWKQLTYMKGTKIITLTFTAEAIQYKNFEAVANIILLSFNHL